MIRKQLTFISFIFLGISMISFMLWLGMHVWLKIPNTQDMAVPGKMQNIEVKTVKEFYNGYFVAKGEGRFVITQSNDKELLKSEWPAHGKGNNNWGNNIDVSSMWSRPSYWHKGKMRAQIEVPSMEIDEIIKIKGKLIIGGITPQPIDDKTFRNEFITAQSDTFEILVYPPRKTVYKAFLNNLFYFYLSFLFLGMFLLFASDKSTDNSEIDEN